MAARKHRKRVATPKGEAARSLDHVKRLSHEIVRLSEPGHEDVVADRFNDFLRAARTVTEFLQKEDGRGVNLDSWVAADSAALEANDTRYPCLMVLRTVSSHDLNIRPDHSDVSIRVQDELRLTDNTEVVLRDEYGTEMVRVYSMGPPSPNTYAVIGTPETRVKYFLSRWPNEDIATFCIEVTKTLADFVGRTYAKFP